MQPKLYSINALAVELRHDRRSLSRALETLPAAKTQTQNGRTLRWYYLVDVVAHLHPPPGTDADYDDQRQRLAAAQAEKVEHDNAVRRGKLADVNEVERYWTDCIANARAKLLGLPARLAPSLPESSRAAVVSRARELVHEALAELAEYEPPASE